MGVLSCYEITTNSTRITLFGQLLSKDNGNEDIFDSSSGTAQSTNSGAYQLRKIARVVGRCQAISMIKLKISIMIWLDKQLKESSKDDRRFVIVKWSFYSRSKSVTYAKAVKVRFGYWTRACCVGFHLTVMENGCLFDDTVYDSANETKEAFQCKPARKLYELMSWSCLILIPRPGDLKYTQKRTQKYSLLHTYNNHRAQPHFVNLPLPKTSLEIFSDWLVFYLYFILYISRIHLHSTSVQSDIECLFSLLAPSCAARLLFAPSVSILWIYYKKIFSRDEFNWSLKMKSKTETMKSIELM